MSELFSLTSADDLSAIPTGDMPGDKVQIGESHVAKANAIFPRLWEMLQPVFDEGRRAVISVHGGSGVGKSEIGSLLAFMLRKQGKGAYVLSGDNYPRRIPEANDAERLRTFRSEGLFGFVNSGEYTSERGKILAGLWETGTDSAPAAAVEHPWLRHYQRAGKEALRRYLGTDKEINFDEVNGIIAEFHAGAESINLKRMGRVPEDIWYEAVDMTGIDVLVVEWTHGNNERLEGIDVPILLSSTPEETLAHRRARARDGATDTPFTMMVLELEQEKLHAGASRAGIIINKAGELVDFRGYLEAMGKHLPEHGAMLNVYPDSIGDDLSDLTDLVQRPEVQGAFTSAYLLPSVFNSDLDRGFSVISYDLNDRYVGPGDMEALREQGLALKFDVVLNHASVLSPQFQDLLRNGEKSEYKDFFIDWNQFWKGHGEMTSEGYIQPDEEVLEGMFFRKPGLPILMVRMPDGTEKPYWNTFYQEVRYRTPDTQDLMEATGLQYGIAQELAGRVSAAIEGGAKPSDIDFTGFEEQQPAVVDWLESRRRYLGQMDLNIKSPKVWEFYNQILDQLKHYGAEIVRLDAFAYAPKEVGEKNFLNEPGTWELLDSVRDLADKRGLMLLPEIHSRYDEKIHEKLSGMGYLTYDFFLPGLIIDALHRKSGEILAGWMNETLEKGIRTVNMLGCHDGIPLLDLKGLLPDSEIEALIELVVSRGGYVKDLHGSKATYYQVNATYFSALGESEQALLLARALQIFTPGKPQVWYLDLFAGKNDHEAVARAGAGGHKEINRTNLDAAAVDAGLASPVVQRQLELLKFRNSFPAFGWDGVCSIELPAEHELRISWKKGEDEAVLEANLETFDFRVTANGQEI